MFLIMDESYQGIGCHRSTPCVRSTVIYMPVTVTCLKIYTAAGAPPQRHETHIGTHRYSCWRSGTAGTHGDSETHPALSAGAHASTPRRRAARRPGRTSGAAQGRRRRSTGTPRRPARGSGVHCALIRAPRFAGGRVSEQQRAEARTQPRWAAA